MLEDAILTPSVSNLHCLQYMGSTLCLLDSFWDCFHFNTTLENLTKTSLSSDTAVQNNVMGLTYTVDSHAVNTMVFVAQHGQEVANGVANGSKSETAPLPARWQRNSHLRQASEVLDSHFCNIQETEHSHCTICVALNSMTHWTARLIDKILTQDPTSATYCSSLINIITLFPKHFR